MHFPLKTLRRSTSLAVLATGGAVLALGLVGSALATPITGPFEVDDGTDSFAIKGYTYTSANATGVLGYGGNSSSTNATGVAGYVTSPLSVGVTGYAASSGVNAYGVYGYSNTGPGVYGKAGNNSVASIYGENDTSGGEAIYGYSPTGTAIYASSGTSYGVFGTTDASNNYIAGVAGVSLSTHFDYGVIGTASTGDGGVFEGNGAGAYGLYASSTGPFEAINAYSGTGDGVVATSQGNYGLSAHSNASNSYASLAAPTGEGVEAFGTSGNASHPAIAAYDKVGRTDLIGTYGYYEYGGTPIETFIVQANTLDNSLEANYWGSDVQISGDLYISGRVYDGCGEFPETDNTHCDSGTSLAHLRSTGATVTTYQASQSVPTMEDLGEGQLVNGQASISLERTFAQTIDASRPYLVFITPEGDSNGLYVTAKTANGFVVRESKGGRSTLAFQYRIVAHPYGNTAARLAAVVPGAKRMAGGPLGSHAGLHGAALGAALGMHVQAPPSAPNPGHVSQRVAPPYFNTNFLKH